MSSCYFSHSTQLASTAVDRLLPQDLTVAQFTLLNHCVRMRDAKTPAQLAEILQVTRVTIAFAKPAIAANTNMAVSIRVL